MPLKLMIACALLFVGYPYIYAQSTIVQFSTKYGNFKVMLYDFTPKHSEMFVKNVKDGTYKKVLFNRIIHNFVVQGGEHDDDILLQEKQQGYSFPRLAPEFDERAFHKMGALGAGRDDNPEKASFMNQIYFVVGRKFTPEAFDSLAQKHNKTYTAERRNYYIQHGGQPRLDGDYTVFGEVIEGLEVLLKISKIAVDKNHYPKKKVRFKVKIIKE